MISQRPVTARAIWARLFPVTMAENEPNMLTVAMRARIVAAPLRPAAGVDVRGLTARRRQRELRCFGCDACDDATAVLSTPGLSTTRLIDHRQVSLLRPNECGRRAAAVIPSDLAATVLRLILDGALRLKVGRSFVCGFEAAEWIGLPADDARRSGSDNCLEYGAALAVEGATHLAMRLYRFGSLPLTARWQSATASNDYTANMLGLAPRAKARRHLDRRWVEIAFPIGSAWAYWQRRGTTGAFASPFKIYVSIDASELRNAFAPVLEALAQTRATSFKVARTAEALSRPDRLVAYYPTLDSLLNATTTLAAATVGHTVHEVSFAARLQSCELGWGVDPPPTFCRFRHASWRSSIAEHAASYLRVAAATGASSVTQCARFARWRLSLDGIDTTHWCPSLALRHQDQ